jgi:tetratricopeptide (TPR) repeat protein
MRQIVNWPSIVAALTLIFGSASCFAQQQGFGQVSFANSGSAAAQAEFLWGLAQLHNFEYPDAADHFRKAQQVDPDFAMAYWGEAMTKTHPLWHQQEVAPAREILGHLGATPEARLAKARTEREKAYLRAVEILYGDGTKEQRDKSYESAMAGLHRQYPEDVDAASFYALAILGTAEQGRDFATYMKAAAVLEEVFPRYPNHPGVVHYLIHCYDDSIHAPLGLRAARIYSKIASEAGHAQHMTSHIFLALGMWDAVAKANETAVDVVNRSRQKAGKPPGACGHYNYWLEYSYLQQGRITDARRLLDDCRRQAEQMAGTPAGAAASADPDTSLVGSYSQMRARFLIDSQLWDDDVVRWTLPAGEFPGPQLTFDYTNAIAAFKRKDDANLRLYTERATSDRQKLEAWLDQRTIVQPQYRKHAQIVTEQLQALLSLRQGKTAEAVKELQRIAEAERAMPFEFGPPSIDKPTDELLGEILLALNRPSEARDAFQLSLARMPGRSLVLSGLAQGTKMLGATNQAESKGTKPSAGDAHTH